MYYTTAVDNNWGDTKEGKTYDKKKENIRIYF